MIGRVSAPVKRHPVVQKIQNRNYFIMNCRKRISLRVDIRSLTRSFVHEGVSMKKLFRRQISSIRFISFSISFAKNFQKLSGFKVINLSWKTFPFQIISFNSKIWSEKFPSGCFVSIWISSNYTILTSVLNVLARLRWYRCFSKTWTL